MTMVASILTLSGEGCRSPGPTAHGLLLGGGGLLLWLTAVRYLEFSRSTYSIVLTLQRAAPRVIVFVAGALPVFLAYASFGVAVFGPRVAGFSGMRRACVTLFAVLNGDVILDTFTSLATEYPISGQVFMYTFVSLFIYVVLNILIALVEEAFFQSSEETAAILQRQRELQGLARTSSNSQAQPIARLQSRRTWRDLADVDLLREAPVQDPDALESTVSGRLTSWQMALRLYEWDEVGGQAEAAAALASSSALEASE